MTQQTYQFNYTNEFEPDSSWVEAVYYNRDSKNLAVVTEGRHYVYSDVPLSVYQDGEESYSAGAWYNYDIKGKYAAHPAVRNPDDPINYVLVAAAGYSLGTHLPTNPDELEYKILAVITVDKTVKAATLQDAIAEFEANPGKYLNIDVKGVQLIDS